MMTTKYKRKFPYQKNRKKRYLYTFAFKGRPRRGLYWKKSIYKEWYEWCLLTNCYPKDFGDLKSFNNFDDWWSHPDYGFELFCEPVEPPAIQIIKQGLVDPSRLNISIEPNASLDKVLLELKSLVMENHIENKTPISEARYQPNISAKYIKLQTIKRYRKVFQLRQNGASRAEVIDSLIRSGEYLNKENSEHNNFEALERKVSRDYQRAKNLIQMVKLGTFGVPKKN